MKKRALSLIFLIASLSVGLTSCNNNNSNTDDEEILYVSKTDPSTIFDGYYKDLVSWKNSMDLKRQLYNIVSKDFTAIGYNQYGTNWDTNRNADQSLYNFDKVHLLYSDSEEYKQTGNNTTNWQREHCWPASLMTGLGTGDAVNQLGTATDFHNLYASYSAANSAHSNTCIGNLDIDKSNTEDGGWHNVGTAYVLEDNLNTPVEEKGFEPGDKDKGKMARAIFYMGLMYGKENFVKDTDANGNKLVTGLQIVSKNSTQKCSLQSAQMGIKCHENKEDLVEWNNRFLPDRLELQHTNYVQSEQHNRNPFVDFPGLIDYIYGDKQGEDGKLINIPNIYDILDLGNDEVNNIAVKNVKVDYDGGDIYDSTKDLEIYTVSKSFKVNKLDDYSISGVEDQKPLSYSDNGKVVNIKFNDDISYSYRINVAPEKWNEFNYKYTILKDNLKKGENTKEYNGINWSIDFGDAKTIKTLDRNEYQYGINVGSNSSPAGEITIKSLENIAVDDKDIIKSIYIETNTTRSYYGNYYVIISIDDEVVFEKNIYNVRDSSLQSVGVNLSTFNQKRGKVKIQISNINTGFRIGRVGILVDNTRG